MEDTIKVISDSYKTFKELLIWGGVSGIIGAIISITGSGFEEKGIMLVGVLIMVLGLVLLLSAVFIKATKKPQLFYFNNQEIKIKNLYADETKYINYEQIGKFEITSGNTLLLKDCDGHIILDMKLSTDFTETQILKIRKELSKKISKVVDGEKEGVDKKRTFMRDPGLPIWPMILVSIVCVSLIGQAGGIVCIMFLGSMILYYKITHSLAKVEFDNQLKNDKVTKNLVTINFIFRKFLVCSFWWVFVVDFVLLSVPFSAFIKLFIFLCASIYIPQKTTEGLVAENTCEKCGALWSYEVTDCKLSDVESHQELQYRVTKDLNNNWVERPVIADVTTGIIHKVFECVNCGHKIKSQENFYNDGRSGIQRFSENMIRQDRQGRGAMRHLRDGRNLKRI